VTRRIVSVLDAKLWRDFWTMRGQALAIGLVIAAGVAIQLVMGGMLTSLTETREAYYERTRFADVWAPAVRAPNALIEDIRAVEGVAAVETRITAPILFDIEGMAEPPTGVIYSLPRGPSSVSEIYMLRGERPDPAHRNDVVVLESFALAHGFDVGDEVSVTIRGKRESLNITGLALSPEYVYSIAPGQLVPDPRLFGVLWMDRQALETAADQDGAFSEAVVRLGRGVEAPPVQAALDRILEPYGGVGSYTRREHVSDAFLDAEIEQLQTMGRILPPIFLAVAAFLVNVVVSRLIAVEREQIGLLKAFGYGSLEVSVHYLKLVGMIGLLGLAIGFGLGLWLGHAMAVMFTEYYRFPFLVFSVPPAVYATGVIVTLIAVGGGALWSVSQAARLQPAVAMRPPPPPDYSRAAGAAVIAAPGLDQQTRMILRQLLRWPLRAGLTALGIAASGATLVMTMYFTDAMDVMVERYFDIANRQDVSVYFVEARSMSAFHELARREGVLEAEPFRQANARLRFENREVLHPLTGALEVPLLSRMIADDHGPASSTPGGLVLSEDLANRLGVTAGDVITAQITEGARPTLQLPVVATPTVLVGSGAQMRLDDLNAALGESRVVSGAHLRVDARFESEIYYDLKAAPLVGAVQLQSLAKDNFNETLDRSMGSAIVIYTLFAGMIALGVIYNAVRVSLAERQRELASLRVLGFSRGDVSYILLGEAGFLTLVAIPVGLVLGTFMAYGIAQAMATDFYRLPFLIYAETYGYAALVLILITLASGLVVRRRIDTLDLVEVLKTRE